MSKLQLIGGSASNFVWVCRIALAEKGVPYDLIPTMPHTPEVNAIHPFGKIPVMRHGDVTLCESRAICLYIDRAFAGPRLFPDDVATAAKLEQWLSMVCANIDPVWIRTYFAEYVFPSGPDKTADRARIAYALPRMEKQFPAMDQAVASGHLVGDSFTLADAYLVPILFYMRRAPESAALLANSPNLTAYLDRHLARPSVAGAMPDSFPGSAARAA